MSKIVHSLILGFFFLGTVMTAGLLGAAEKSSVIGSAKQLVGQGQQANITASAQAEQAKSLVSSQSSAVAPSAQAQADQAKGIVGSQSSAISTSSGNESLDFWHRGFWGPRYGFYGPRYGFYGPRYGFYGPRYGFYGPRYGFYGPRYGYAGCGYGLYWNGFTCVPY